MNDAIGSVKVEIELLWSSSPIWVFVKKTTIELPMQTELTMANANTL